MKSTLIVLGLIITGIASLIWLVLFGLEPIAYWVASAQVYRIQHSLRYGEPRSEIEAQFGKGYPVVQLGVVRYSYSYGGLCVETDMNVDVTYDAAGRLTSWRRDDASSGC